jgi:hypothetical protein
LSVTNVFHIVSPLSFCHSMFVSLIFHNLWSPVLAHELV